MSLKAYVTGNVFYLVDTITNVEYTGRSGNVEIEHRNYSGNDFFYFHNVLNFPKGRPVLLSEILNEASGAYTLGTLKTFIQDETGGFNSPGNGADFAEYQTTSDQVVLLNDDGVTYVAIPNMTLGLSSNFSVTTGVLKKTIKAGTFLINGVSDLEVNKAATVSYALFINGTLVPSEITPHTFTNQSKIENISITAIGILSLDDTIEVRAKGDGTLAVSVTVRKLDVTFVEIK